MAADPVKLRAFREDAIAQGIPPEQVDAEIQKIYAQEGKAGLLESAFVTPVKRYGELVAEAGHQAFNLTDPDVRAVVMGKSDTLTPEQLDNAIAKLQPKFMSEADLKDRKTIAEQGIRRTAGAASLAVPGGGGVAGVAARGALAGGLAATGAGGDAGDIAKGAAFGAPLGVGGKVAGNVIGKVGGKFAGKAGAAPETVARKAAGVEKQIVAPKVKAGPFMAEEKTAIVQGLKDAGIKIKSAANIEEQMPKAFRDLSSKIKVKLDGVGNPVPWKRLRQNFVDVLPDRLIVETPAQARVLKSMLGEMAEFADDAGNITLKDLHDFKLLLGRKYIGGNFEKGTSGSFKQESAREIWDIIDGYFAKEFPQVKNLTRLQSQIYKASEGIQKQAETGTRIPFLNFRSQTLAELMQSGQAKSAEALNFVSKMSVKARNAALGERTDIGKTVGKFVDSVPPKLKPTGLPTAGEFAGRAYGGQQALPDTPAINPNAEGDPTATYQDLLYKENQDRGIGQFSEDGLWEWNGETWIPTQTHIDKMLINDFAATGGKNITKINALAKSFEEEGPTGQAAKAQALTGSIDLLMRNYHAAKGGQGLVGLGRSVLARTPGIRSANPDWQAGVFEDQRAALIAPLARAISGEVGVLTDRDIKRAEGLLPRLGDVPQRAKEKEADLRTLIQQSATAGTPNAGILQTGDYLEGLPEQPLYAP